MQHQSPAALSCLTGPPGAGTNMLAGTISWLGGCALWATSVEYVRRRFFELFYKTHILGLITFFMFGFMHHVSLWAYTMPGALPHTPCTSMQSSCDLLRTCRRDLILPSRLASARLCACSVQWKWGVPETSVMPCAELLQAFYCISWTLRSVWLSRPSRWWSAMCLCARAPHWRLSTLKQTPRSPSSPSRYQL